MTAIAEVTSEYVELGGVRVHFTRRDGPADGPTFVLVHGLGGALNNWSGVSPLLAQRGRVFSLDLAGFGLTFSEPKRSTIAANAALLDEFISAISDRPVVLVGNSMGGYLTAMQAATRPGSVAGAVLIDPAIPLTPNGRPHPMVALMFGTYAVPGLGKRIIQRRLASMSIEQVAEQTMRLVTTKYDQVPAALKQQHIDVSYARKRDYPSGDDAFLTAAKSLLWQLGRRGKYRAMMQRITAPVLLIHGDRDLLVHVSTARALAARNPSWTYVEGRGIGHTPMLDFPEWTAETILTWLDAAAPGFGGS